ncbi:MAG: MinD/ParA family protein [Thermodesulfovibrionales bacterium]|nr:MinD/ParA family protein [Thermodesulfovibrionales bacterium]
MLRKDRKNKNITTIAISSGKGGVGKSNIVANLAIAIRKLGKEVMILDADLGLSNIDVLFQLAPKYNIYHVLNGNKSLVDVITKGPHGIKILPASSGIQELTALDEFQRLKILEEFDSYDGNIDVLLIDTAAGISENVAFFCVAAQEIIIITAPEPTALTDAYALIKVLSTRYQERSFNVLINSVNSNEEAEEIFRRLYLVAERFLSISLKYLGYIPYDESVKKAVRMQRPFVDIYPDSPASKKIYELAPKLLEMEGKIKGSLQFFIGNLLSVGRNK